MSICSNIAEGAARSYPKEFIRFLNIALGSASEIETQLEIAVRLGYIESIDQEKEMLDRPRKMVGGLIRHIRNKTITPAANP